MAAVVPFPDRRPLPDPSPLVFVIADLWAELQETRAELRRARGLPPESDQPRLRLVV